MAFKAWFWVLAASFRICAQVTYHCAGVIFSSDSIAAFL
jgi:hypothetical protein